MGRTAASASGTVRPSTPTPIRAPQISPLSNPDHVFDGETRGTSFAAADHPAAEIGHDIGAPDDREKPEDRFESVENGKAQEADRDDERRRIDKTAGAPQTLAGTGGPGRDATAPAKSTKTAASNEAASAREVAAASAAAPTRKRSSGRSPPTIRCHSQ